MIEPVRVPSASPKHLAHKHQHAIRRASADLNFLNRALAKLERRLAADPDDAEKLRQMGDLQRKLGNFDAASETYRKLKAVDEDAGAAWWAWWIGALNGEELPASAPEERHHPTPFVRIPGFLTAAQQNVLLDAVRKGAEHFAPAWINKGDKGSVVLDTRAAFVAKKSVRRRIRPWFVEELHRVVGDVFEHFRIDDTREYHVELAVTAHRRGGFYLPHRDSGHARTNSRLVSFAYYFHREPKGFAGGELLLYDTCIATDRYRATAFSRIEPISNSLVLFPSAYYHEVLPVRTASDAFENARFTVNGWLHRASEGKPFGHERTQAEAAP